MRRALQRRRSVWRPRPASPLRLQRSSWKSASRRCCWSSPNWWMLPFSRCSHLHTHARCNPSWGHRYPCAKFHLLLESPQVAHPSRFVGLQSGWTLVCWHDPGWVPALPAPRRMLGAGHLISAYVTAALQDAADLAPEKPEAPDAALVEPPKSEAGRQQGRSVHRAETAAGKAARAPSLVAGGSEHASGGSRGGGPEAAGTAGDEALAAQLAFGSDEGDSGRDDAQELPRDGVKTDCLTARSSKVNNQDNLSNKYIHTRNNSS